MNKKLVTLAVGAALGLSSVVAEAKVTVYGHAQVEVGNREVKDTTPGNNLDQQFVRDQARGRLGVKSAEKLGNGMTAIAKFEWLIDTTRGGQGLKQRESFVGLKGSFGTIELGNLKSPYKYWGGVSYDPFVASNLEARSAGGMSGQRGNTLLKTLLGAPINAMLLGDNSYGHSAFVENSIGYKSPNWNGLQIWGTYSPDEEDDTGNSPVADGDWTFGVRYKNGPFEIGVAAVKNKSAVPSATRPEADAVKVFGKYKWGNHTFLGQYENIDTDNGVSQDYDTDIWFVGYHLRFGNNTFVAQVGNTDVDRGPLANVEVDYYTLGVIHHLSKKTRLFGGYRNSEGSTTGRTIEEQIWSVGLRVIF